MERPDRFAGRTVDTIREEELAQFGRESNETRRQGETQNNGFNGLSPQRFDLKPSRAWFVIDPPDGRIPPLTELGRQRSSAYAAQMRAAPTSAESQYRVTSAAGPDLHVTERFTPTKSGAIEWRVTIEDQSAWTAPWTFSMPLRRVDESQQPLEEGCHEGNYPLRNMLSGARADDRSTDEATVK